MTFSNVIRSNWLQLLDPVQRDRKGIANMYVIDREQVVVCILDWYLPIFYIEHSLKKVQVF
jgi:hypothetical protein